MFRGAGLVRFGLALSLMLSASFTWAADPAKTTVDKHLAAGEFGLAAEAAAAVENPAAKSQLLEQVAAAQLANGSASAARATINRLGDNQRATAWQRAAQQAGLSGGAATAFAVANMIMTNTTDLWRDNGTGDGTISTWGDGTAGNGVRVDPNGLLAWIAARDNTGKLASLGGQIRRADLNADLAQPSRLRFVSLKRLEREVALRLEQGLPIPESMAQFAGLTQVQYVALDQAEGDIILGGPAEGWQYIAPGQPVGVSSGRPTLQLDDFVVVFRAFAQGAADFGCSINTRDAGVKALQEFVAASQSRGPINANSVRNWVRQLQNKLGRQDIVVWGVPADSRVARVIVEADYRMKLIGIDKLEAGKAIPSYFDLLATGPQKNPPPMEALRWWLTMKYDAVLHSPDKNAFEIQGSSVRCLSENQMLTAEGKHLPTGQSEPTNRLFAENFTNHYAELAQRDLVFADMQNIFDLSLVAALIKQERLADRSGWNPGVLAATGTYRPAKHVVPREIDSVVNHKVYNGRDIVVQVAGGVRGDLLAVVNDPAMTKESKELVRLNADAPQLPAGRWWWDAAK
uniref:DUF1598 domain-containing protein n=1 Tax=Schlesneria paludicola TaxID=360056 RepID=A0A7C2K1E7_9PLAN